MPVAVQLGEAFQRRDVVEASGRRGMAREMHALPRREIGEDLDSELSGFFFKRADLAREIHPARLVEFLEVGDLVLKLRQRLLEFDDDVHAEIA